MIFAHIAYSVLKFRKNLLKRDCIYIIFQQLRQLRGSLLRDTRTMQAADVTSTELTVSEIVLDAGRNRRAVRFLNESAVWMSLMPPFVLGKRSAANMYITHILANFLTGQAIDHRGYGLAV